MRFNSRDIANIYFRELRAGRPLYERYQTTELEKVKITIEEIRKTQKLKRAVKRRYGLEKAEHREDAKQRFDSTNHILTRRTQRLKKQLDLRTNAFIETQQHALNMLTNKQIFEFTYTVINFSDKSGKMRVGAKRNIQNINQYIATKIIIQNIKKTILRSQLSRDQLVEGLINTLDSQIPMTLIKTDIKSFYPSLRHNHLRELISRCPLTGIERDMLLESIDAYSATANTRVGIPQGDPVSALLGEMVGQRIEQQFEAMDAAIYIARFVDDFVVVLAGLHGTAEIAHQLREIEDIHNIQFGESKTHVLYANDINNMRAEIADSAKINVAGKFDFLGYCITVAPTSNGSTAKIELRRDTFDRCKQQIFCAFENFDRSPQRSGDLGRLTESLRWLIYNARLNNAKSHVLTGLYFNYRHLQPLNQLKTLDRLIDRGFRVREQQIMRVLDEVPDNVNVRPIAPESGRAARKYSYLIQELSFERSFESKLVTRTHKSKKRR